MLVLSESDVRASISVADAIGSIETILRDWGTSAVQNYPRIRTGNAAARLNILPASAGTGIDGGFIGLKSYSVTQKGGGHLVVLYSASSGRLAAVIEAGYLGALRTGAVSAVATRVMHGPVRSLGCIGAGPQAEMQIRALAESNQLEEVTIFGRTRSRSQAMAQGLRDLTCPVRVASSAVEAASGSDAICTVTRAERPVLMRHYLESGTHINAAGSNALNRQEIGVDILRDADIVLDDRDQARIECGDILPLVEAGERDWESFVELGDIVSGKEDFVANKPFTVFESQGMGLLDIALATTLVRKWVQ